MKLTVNQDGFRLDIIDHRTGGAHCFRIDKDIGAEIKRRVELFPPMHAAAQLASGMIEGLLEYGGLPLDVREQLTRARINLTSLLAKVPS